MKQELKIAIAGLGVVGGGVYEILIKNIDLLNQRCKKKLKLVAICSRSKKDFVNQSQVKCYNNALDLAEDKDIDLIVELIGGSDGIAYELCKKSLKNKKNFVTANKALIAIHGLELAKLAEENNVSLRFEAGVAGAIPILKSLREGLGANKIDQIYAILNGTCNYILTKMEENEASFDEVLKEAQNLGYAESDPTFDIQGIDTAHKLAILVAIAKNSQIDFDNIYVEGITKISIDDIKLAKELGYKIKLLGIFKDIDANKIEQAVYPCLVKSSNNIANIDDSYNAILAHGNNCEWSFQVGRGAGAAPTASAVVADILDVANDNYNLPFGSNIANLINIDSKNIAQRVGGYYLRFNINKEFAREGDFIQEVFAKKEIITKSIIKEINQDQLIYALMIDNISENDINKFLEKINLIKEITNVNLIRIEDIK